MSALRDQVRGLAAASFALGLWFIAFFVTEIVLVPGNTRGWTQPWGPGDIVAGAALIGGAYHAARYCRFLPLYFTYGAIGGLLYVMAHWPGANEFFDMPRGYGVLVRYGVYWLAITVGVGLLCRVAASTRHQRLDAVAERDVSHCRKCGYLLYGLPEPRCPECGEPFEPPIPSAEAEQETAQALRRLADSSGPDTPAARDADERPKET